MRPVAAVALLSACAGRFAFAAEPAADVPAEPEAEEHRLNDADTGRFLAETEKRLSTVSSLWAFFVQEKRLSLFSDVIRSRGVLLFSQPDLLRWETLEPFHSLLVANGNAIAKYEFRDGKRRKLRLGAEGVVRAVIKQMSMWHRGKFTDKAGMYDVSVYSGGAHRVVLVPKDERMRGAIQSIEMRFSKDRARVDRVTINESGGDKTVIAFHSERRDNAIPERFFDTKDPAAYEDLKPKPDTAAAPAAMENGTGAATGEEGAREAKPSSAGDGGAGR
jgi:outer membrane lipoprotein-sorting protein